MEGHPVKRPTRRTALQALGMALIPTTPAFAASAGAAESRRADANDAKRILVVVSSHDRKGEDLVAGFWFPELTHPAQVIVEAGLSFDIASPTGGMPPFDGFDLKDEANRWFWIQPTLRDKLARSIPLADVDAARYAAVMLVGGHGPMWDFVDNPRLHAIVRDLYERGGVVGAVCHGPAGLLKVALSDGRRLVAGRRLTAFTHEEEVSRQYDRLVPFDLETALKGARVDFSESGVFQSHVVVDGRLITGQNPASAKAFGEAVVAALKKRNA